MKQKEQTGWAIIGEYGLYTGWWLTRSEAIKAHCKMLKGSWEYCKRKNDRAIKIKITWI